MDFLRLFLGCLLLSLAALPEIYTGEILGIVRCL